MLKYSKYLYINILSRKTFWIALLLSVATIATLGIMHIIQVNNGDNIAIRSIDQNDKFLPFVLSSLMTALLVVFIFKSGQQDGTDLLVAAKPISRVKMILGKFIVLSVFLIAIQTLLFLTYFSYSQKDIFGTPSQKFYYALALSVGGLIIQFIVASFVALAALFLSRVGLLVMTLLTVSTIPIVSIIVSQISMSHPSKVVGITWPKTLIDAKQFDEATKQMDGVYKELHKEEDANGKTTNPMHDLSTITDERFEEEQEKLDIYKYTTFKKQFVRWTNKKYFNVGEEYKEKNWYKSFAPFDMWYHWSGFYDQMLPGEIDPKQKWNTVEKVVDLDTRYSMNPITKTNTGDMFSNIFLQTINRTIVESPSKLKNINKMFNKLKDNNVNVKGEQYNFQQLFSDPKKSFYFRMESLMRTLQPREMNIIRYSTYMIYKKLITFYKQQQTDKYELPNTIFPATPLAPGEQPEDKGRVLVMGNKLSEHIHEWLLVKDDKVEVWEPTPYVKSSTRIWIWSVLVVLLFGATVFIYYRKDFK